MVINSKLVNEEWRCGGLAFGVDSLPHARVNTDVYKYVCQAQGGCLEI